MAVYTDTTRRQILASAAAILLPLPVLAEPLPATAGGLAADDMALAHEFSDALCRIPELLKYFEERDAVFSRCKQPGWYQVAWSDPDISDEPRRWAASVDDSGADALYARTFRAKVEGWDKF